MKKLALSLGALLPRFRRFLGGTGLPLPPGYGTTLQVSEAEEAMREHRIRKTKTVCTYPDTTYGDSTFGLVSSTLAPPRHWQFGLRFEF